MALLFQATTSIKRAVSIINEIDSSKFPSLLSRILQKLHLKDDKSFSEEEEDKLQSAFKLPPSELELLIEALEFFLQQAAYHTAKPAILSQQLLELEIDQDKVNVIVESWTNSGRGVVQKLRERTIAPKQLHPKDPQSINENMKVFQRMLSYDKNVIQILKLTDVNWRLNLQMAQQNKTKMKLPNAQFELGIHNEDTEEKEKLRMEFSHDELFEFYNQLEKIQKQLDGLS